MKTFFVGESPHFLFQLFGPIHITCILLVVIGLYLIYRNRKKIANMDLKVKDRIRIFIVILLFLNMTIYYLSKLYYGTWTWKNDLPLHLCFIAGYLFMYALLTKNWKLYKITYFLSFIGPIPAILWPDLHNSLSSFVFYQQVISHHVFLLSTFFILYAYQVSFERKDVWKTIITLGIIFGSMSIFNHIFHTNYIFSTGLPEHVLNLYPFLRNLDNPFLLLLGSGIVLLFLAYIPVYYHNIELEQEKKDSV